VETYRNGGSHQAAIAGLTGRSGRDEWLAPTMRRALMAKPMSEPSREEYCHDCCQPGRP